MTQPYVPTTLFQCEMLQKRHFDQNLALCSEEYLKYKEELTFFSFSVSSVAISPRRGNRLPEREGNTNRGIEQESRTELSLSDSREGNLREGEGIGEKTRKKRSMVETGGNRLRSGGVK